jgi:hypothetical protein
MLKKLDVKTIEERRESYLDKLRSSPVHTPLGSSTGKPKRIFFAPSPTTQVNNISINQNNSYAISPSNNYMLNPKPT